VFSLVNNFAYGLYDQVISDILKVQQDIEQRAVALIPAIDKAAQALYEKDKDMLTDYLTLFSVNNVEKTTESWRELARYLLVKYNDRYIRDEMRIDAWPRALGYPEEFLREAVEERPGYYDVRWRSKNEHQQ